MSTPSPWVGRVQRAFNLRVFLATMFAGIVAGVIAGLAWAPLSVPVAFVVWALAWLMVVLNDWQMTACDACRKSVKMGATTCHHCGYSRPQESSTTPNHWA